MKVFKFGGASVKDAESIRNIGRILQSEAADNVLIVVSAMGKTTNALEAVVLEHKEQTGKARELLSEIMTWHFSIIQELFDPTDEVIELVNDAFVEIDWALDEPPHENYDYMYDQVVSVGELVSSHIVTGFLNKQGLPTAWLDARDIILTDDVFREGWVQWEETRDRYERIAKPLLEEHERVLTQGFIGSTSENFTTTLGREGSDYSAAIFSFCMDVESMTIWKDVPGVLTADPRLFENVVKIDRLSYREAIEMTYYGAKVIHPKTIKPLQNKNIPLFVKSFLDPEESGTYISSEIVDNYPPMVSIEKNQALLYISTRDFSFVAERHISFLFKLITDLRIRVNMMQNTAISFAICVNDVDDKIERFTEKVEEKFKVLVDRELELISVRHFKKEILESLKQNKVVLLEERLKNTVQMVVKPVPMMQRK